LSKQSAKRRSVGKRSRKEPTNGRKEPSKQAEKEQSVPLVLDRDELVDMLQDCLTNFATDVGLKVACLLFDKQVDMRRKQATLGQVASENGSSLLTNRRLTLPRKQPS
jgi:hypothetical protein